MTSNKKNTLFLNTLLFIGLFYTYIPIQVDAIPVQLIPSERIKYPIHIACECDYYLYVDDKYIEQANTEVNIEENWEQGHPGWNATKKFYPVIDNEIPKIIAFNGIGGQFSGFLNGFIMDFNDGKDYTKYQEWKCKDFSKSVNNAPPPTPPPPPNWFTFDYDDSDWNVAVSFGENYQNNSFQIFQHEREGINLKAEWLWTSDNSNKNIYCRKKNTNIITTPPPSTSMPLSSVSTTIHPSTSAPIRVQTSAPILVQTSAPIHVQTSAHIPVQTSAHIPVQTSAHIPVQTSAPIHVQTSAPMRVSTTIHTTPVQTSTPIHVQTSAPIPVQTSAPIHVQTSAPIHVQTSTPIHVQTSAPIPVQTSAPIPVQTSAHIPVQTSAHIPVQTSAHIPVQTSAPIHVQTSAPIHVQISATPSDVSTTIHTTPVQTSAPIRVQTSAPIHVQTSTPMRVQTSAPIHVQTSTPMRVQTSTPMRVPVPTIVISPHIQIIIQNIKYSQRRSYAHLDNLFRKLKLYNDEYSLYKQLMIARLHLRQHYSAIFYDIKHLLEKQNNYDYIPTPTPTPTSSIDKNDNKKSVKNIPRYIHSMHTLNECIKKIEKSIQFIKGNHKYILLRILNKLKIQYQQDTEKLFMLIKNT